MQKNQIRWVLFTAFIIIYNYLFWKERLGINLFLFSLAMGAAAFSLNRESIRSPRVVVTAAGTFISGLFVVIHHSDLSVIVHIFSFFVMLGFMQEGELRSLYHALMQSVSGLLLAPKHLLQSLVVKAEQNSKTAKLLRLLTLVIFPIIAFFIFYFIYRVANPVFDKLTLKITNAINDFFEYIFKYVSIGWLVFIGFGAVLVAVVLFKTVSRRWVTKDAGENEDLLRIKTKAGNTNLSMPGLRNTFSSVALKNERRSGIIFLCMINLLLLVVNIIDVNWIWFDFYVPAKFNLKQFVHEGTYMLIFSILISMAILLYLFRRNQNFMKGNTLLKKLAYLWVVQNVILCCSVLLRNYHYINYHGLAYKRIGVIVFLVLTFVGLVTLFIKIKEVKSASYLLRKNTWAAYGVFIVLCFFNWDMLIVRYNLNHWNSDDIDIDFYMELSDKVIPELLANADKVKQQMELHKLNPSGRWVNHLDYDSFEQYFVNRQREFIIDYADYHWQSWNYSDAVTYKRLLQKEKKTELGYSAR